MRRRAAGRIGAVVAAVVAVMTTWACAGGPGAGEIPTTTTKSEARAMAAPRKVQTPNAPAAIGPYSQAIVANGFVFTAGQIPLDPQTMQLVEGDVAVQTEQVMKNLQGVLQAAGSDLSAVVKTTVFLRDMNDFTAMNEVYARHLSEPFPARSTVQAARLPRDVAVEIEAVAVLLERS